MELPPSAAPLDALPAHALPTAVTGWVAKHAGRAGLPATAYLYDPTVAAAATGRLRAALPPWAEVFYAVRANTFPPVLAAVLDGGAGGFEVASEREIALATTAAHAVDRPPRLVAAGPGKSVPLLMSLVAAAAEDTVEAVTVESALELARLARFADRYAIRVPVTIRVNPATLPPLGGGAGALRTGGVPGPFGVSEADVPAILELAAGLPAIDVVGFHLHAVSQNLDADAHLTYVAWCLAYAARTAAAHRIDLRVVDVGGGLGVAFEGGDTPFDVDRFGAGVAAMTPPSGARLLLEPGRLLVAACGWYAAEITDVKRSYGSTYLVLRGGIHHFQLPTSWPIVHNFAVVPVERWVAELPRPATVGTPVTVVGELGTPEDTLARDVTVTAARAGDVVVFPLAGAYGWEFAMQEFLGHPRAPRVMVKNSY